MTPPMPDLERKRGASPFEKGEWKLKKILTNWGSKGEVAPNGPDLRGIAAGQRPFVPRAGLEPAAKRNSGVSCQQSPFPVKNL